ncbi:MAG: NADH-quinone oxidoreductase subunit C [Spirochaetales bacterium]|nr:NADH-quinone oxidoreductase subunit C [Spirochaetales bacterium]
MSFINDKLIPTFPGYNITTDDQGIHKINIEIDNLITIASRLHNELNFESLQTISCADWIEDGYLQLNYIFYSYEFNQTVFVSLNLPRELKDDGSKRTISTIPSLQNIWPQANHFERELWEMFGVSVTGHNSLKEFFLEDWQQIPPMRRDFDTLDFVNNSFEFRPGREDAMDVATERKRVREAKASEVTKGADVNEQK